MAKIFSGIDDGFQMFLSFQKCIGNQQIIVEYLWRKLQEAQILVTQVIGEKSRLNLFLNAEEVYSSLHSYLIGERDYFTSTEILCMQL